MNRLCRPALVPPLGFLLLSVVFAGPASGQLTNAIKQAPDIAPHRQTIQSYIDTHVKTLAGEDDEKRGTARERLIEGVSSDSPLSPVYLDFYAGALNKALLPLAKHENMHVRLNAAVAAAKVAQKAENARLVEAAIAFMNDKSGAVALWGVKAARYMLPGIVQQGEKNQLTPAMFQAVQRSITSPIVVEVYDALAMNVFDPAQKPNPAALKVTIPEMVRVLRHRVGMYRFPPGPPEPSVDNVAAEFLLYTPVWQQMTPAQRTEVMQTIADLIGFAGQHAEVMLPEERGPLLPVFVRTGKAIQVVGEELKNKALADAAQSVQKISSQTDGAEIAKRTADVLTAMKSSPQFAKLKDTPKLELLPPDEGAAPPEGTGGRTETGSADEAAGNDTGPSNGGAGEPRNAPRGAPNARPAGAGQNDKAAPGRQPPGQTPPGQPAPAQPGPRQPPPGQGGPTQGGAAPRGPANAPPPPNAPR